MINFFKQLFTWWNKQTLGTFIYTLLFGKFVGSDEFGNKYYNLIHQEKGGSYITIPLNQAKIPARVAFMDTFFRLAQNLKII